MSVLAAVYLYDDDVHDDGNDDDDDDDDDDDSLDLNDWFICCVSIRSLVGAASGRVFSVLTEFMNKANATDGNPQLFSVPYPFPRACTPKTTETTVDATLLTFFCSCSL